MGASERGELALNVRLAILLFTSVVVVAPLMAEAQATGQHHRVGILNGAGEGGTCEAPLREGYAPSAM